MKNYDTIAAIATGTTNAGISIIRVSGTKAFEVVENLFVSKKKEKKLKIKSDKNTQNLQQSVATMTIWFQHL